jgi:hypothetical protein
VDLRCSTYLAILLEGRGMRVLLLCYRRGAAHPVGCYRRCGASVPYAVTWPLVGQWRAPLPHFALGYWVAGALGRQGAYWNWGGREEPDAGVLPVRGLGGGGGGLGQSREVRGRGARGKCRGNDSPYAFLVFLARVR